MSLATELRAHFALIVQQEPGGPATLIQTVSGAYDPETGATGPATPSSAAGFARVGNYADKLVDGTNIRSGDRRVTFQPTDWSVVPKVADQLTAGTDTYNIVAVQKRESGGVPFAYTLQVRT